MEETIKQYNVTFKGYRLEKDAAGLPEYSGIYLVYRCVYDKNTDRVSLRELIYIGQAENLKKRLNPHSRLDDFKKECQNNESVCYSYASISLGDLDVVENALVFAQQPRLNIDLKNNYNHDAASFVIEGACSLLNNTNFSIA